MNSIFENERGSKNIFRSYLIVDQVSCFNHTLEMLFQNWTIHTSYGNEISNNESQKTFIDQILCMQETDNIMLKEANEMSENIDDEENDKIEDIIKPKSVRQHPFHKMKSLKLKDNKFPSNVD